MQLSVIRALSLKSHTFTYPLRVFSRQLKRANIQVQFHYAANGVATNPDVLFVLSDGFEKQFQSKAQMLDALEAYRKRTQALVWCDCGDSTALSHDAAVLPHVDLYLKCQLLKNRQQYVDARHYGGRFYSDYYHRTLGLIDQTESESSPILAEDLTKLRLSWNIGLGDWNMWYRLGCVGKLLRFTWPRTSYALQLSAPSTAQRKIDASYRGSGHHKLATIGFQRAETIRQLAHFSSTRPYKTLAGGKVPYRQFRDEMRDSKIIVSPYGWGEICYRDFECLLSGAALFKADMEHLETWPNFYIKDETYLAHQWNFEDFSEQLEAALASPAKLARTAEQGQRNFAQITNTEFGDTFAQRVSDLIQAAKERRNAG